MSFMKSKLPPLPPVQPPTPVDKSTLTAELAAQGRRQGLRAALFQKTGLSQSRGTGMQKLSGAS